MFKLCIKQLYMHTGTSSHFWIRQKKKHYKKKKQWKKHTNTNQTDVSVIKYHRPSLLTLFETTSLISCLFAFLSSLLHTDTGKQTVGQDFCLAGPVQSGRGGVAQDWASAHHASLPAIHTDPRVCQIQFTYTTGKSLNLKSPTFVAAEGFPHQHTSCTDPDLSATQLCPKCGRQGWNLSLYCGLALVIILV